MAKFHGNLLKDSTLSLFDNANIIFPLVCQFDSKMPLVNFFLDTRYQVVDKLFSKIVHVIILTSIVL